MSVIMVMLYYSNNRLLLYLVIKVREKREKLKSDVIIYIISSILGGFNEKIICVYVYFDIIDGWM